MKTHHLLNGIKALGLCAIFSLMIAVIPAGAQPYETSLTTSTLTENFDELGISASATLPSGWVFAQGVSLPIYDNPLTCDLPPITYFGTATNCQSCARAYDGGVSGEPAIPERQPAVRGSIMATA